MPNHCYQVVDIKGDFDLVAELYTAITEQDRFCNVVFPMPFENWDGDKWYKWRLKHWGTKWDLRQVEIIETDGVTERFPPRKGLVGFSFKCWTAWSPPTPVWEKLTEMDICVTAYYLDEGGFFCGIYEDGEITEDRSLDGELGQIVIKNIGYEIEEAS